MRWYAVGTVINLGTAGTSGYCKCYSAESTEGTAGVCSEGCVSAEDTLSAMGSEGTATTLGTTGTSLPAGLQSFTVNPSSSPLSTLSCPPEQHGPVCAGSILVEWTLRRLLEEERKRSSKRAEKALSSDEDKQASGTVCACVRVFACARDSCVPGRIIALGSRICLTVTSARAPPPSLPGE